MGPLTEEHGLGGFRGTSRGDVGSPLFHHNPFLRAGRKVLQLPNNLVVVVGDELTILVVGGAVAHDFYLITSTLNFT